MKLKLDHINLTVSHLAESVDWYQKVFGFKLVQNGVYSEIKIRWAIVAHSDFMICMHEIKKRKRADTNDQKDFHKVNHFGIRISNLKNWQEKIKRHNLNPIYVKYKYSSSWYITDPNGHGIEVSWTKKPTLYFPPLKNSILKK